MTHEQNARSNPMLEVLRERNFVLLWLGQGASLLGDNFHFIALPWLTLQLTNDPFALGALLALAGIPRALFMLVGGAITDRVSPRTIMLISDLVRCLLSGLIVILVVTGTVNLWALYIIAFAFGFVGGFFQPAAAAIMPSLVRANELQPANAVFAGSAQLLSFIGPLMAGAVIALLGQASVGAGGAGSLGMAIAFGIDALSFVTSILTLWLMSLPPVTRPVAGEKAESIFRSIRAGLAYVWNDPLMRWMFIVVAAANLLFVGPIDVGIPVLAKLRLPEGVAAFGLVVSGYAGGNLIGTILSGMISPRRRFKEFTIILLFAFGFGLLPFGWIPSAWAGAAIFLLLGIGNGYFGIVLITILQKRTPVELMGRMMSLLMLSNVGLVPISQAISGAIIGVSLDALFVGAGSLMLLVALWTSFSPTLGLLVAEVEKSAGALQAAPGADPQ